MSSILTNNGAMVALQTLQQVNKNLGATQAEISTGKSVATARDNSAVWAISKTMESDVAGFKAIDASLKLGQSTVAVARNATETVTDLLTDIKGKIVAAQEENVDRAKIQNDINQLAKQIGSVTGAAQFNGLNLVKGGDDVAILSSLDRSGNGTVADSAITVRRQDLSETADVSAGTNRAATVGTFTDLAADGTATPDGDLTGAARVGTATITALAGAGSADITINGVQISANFDAAATKAEVTGALVNEFNRLKENNDALADIELANDGADDLDITNKSLFNDVTTVAGNSTTVAAGGGAGGVVEATGETVTFAATAAVSAGDGYNLNVGGSNIAYVAREGDTAKDVAEGLAAAINGNTADRALQAKVVEDGGNFVVAFGTTNTGAAQNTTYTETTGNDAGGDLFGLSGIDVTTNDGADRALALVETLVSRAIDAAAELGSAQGRIDTQTDFVSSLIDNFTSGIGSLVDANMEEASARLQALQVQQQLATQSLSIANQAPQSILSLFR